MFSLFNFLRCKKPQTIAVVDLGSNSFHMVVARVQNGELLIIDRRREMVRLAEGLHGDNTPLQADAMARALACLQRFGQRLRELSPEHVRIVGTNPFRIATNCDAFVKEAENAVGHRIEVISGLEEARLIYLGVAASLAEEQGKRLVIDIGGGSTELIIGEKSIPEIMRSIPIGCVSMTERFFTNGKITTKRIKNAQRYAQSLFEPHSAIFKSPLWQQCLGSSGTIRSIERILNSQTLGSSGIHIDNLARLMGLVEKCDYITELNFPGLSKKRQPVFVGGLIILNTLFGALDITQMRVSDSAMREGALYDLISRAKRGAQDKNTTTTN